LNKEKNNKHETDMAVNWIEKARTHLFSSVEQTRERSGKSNLHYITDWKNNYAWKTVVFPINDDTNALLKKLLEHGYKQGQHWSVENNNVVFPPPPANKKSNDVNIINQIIN
jgi:hypothetical protein